MNESKDTSPVGRKSRLKALLVLAIIIVAAVAGAYYYILNPRQQFSMSVNPPFIHGSPGSGGVLLVQVSRVSGFRGDVDVALANPPSWVQVNPLIINSTSRNATLVLVLSKDAPKGSYDLTVVGTAQGSAKQSVAFQMKVVSVSPVTSNYGSALVYETTKVLDSATLGALVSYQNGTLSFRQSTPELGGLDRGDVLAVPPKTSQIVPNGILRFVLDKRNEGGMILLNTRQAGLAEAFQELHVGQPPTATGSGAGLGPSSVRLHPDTGTTIQLLQGDYTPPDSPFPLGGDVKFTLGLSYHADLWAYLDISWAGCDSVTSCHGPRVDDAGLVFEADEHATVGLTGSAGSTLQWDKDNILKDPLYNDAIVIIPAILWIHITVKLHGHAQGTLKQNINLGVDQQFHMQEGPTYDHNNGWQWMNNVNAPLNSPNQIDLPSRSDSGDTPRVEVGPRLDVSLDDIVGPFIQIYLFGELYSQIPHNPVWWVTIGFGVNAGIHVSFLGFVNLDWDLPGAPYDIASWRVDKAPDYPPDTPTITIPSRTLDFTKVFSNPADFQWSAKVPLDPEGDDVCGGQGSVTWYSSTAQDGKKGTGEIGTGCNIDASKVAWSSSGKRQIWAIAIDSGGSSSGAIQAIFKSIEVTVILVGSIAATVEITSSPTGESNEPPNTLYQGTTYDFTAQVYLALASNYHQPLDCNLIEWHVTRVTPVVSASVVGKGCTLNYTPTATGELEIRTVVENYNGQTSSSGWLTYTVKLRPSGYTPPPTVEITSPKQGQQLGTFVVSGQARDLSEVITSSEMTWSSEALDTSGKAYATIPVNPVQGSLTSKVILEVGGKGGITTVTFNWDLNPWCADFNKIKIKGVSLTDASLTLQAHDSQGHPSQPFTVTPLAIGAACSKFQSLPLIPDVALVTLLTVLFAVTAERKTILENKPWLRLLRGTFTVQM